MQREELNSHEKRISEAEMRISTLEDSVDPVASKLSELEKQACEGEKTYTLSGFQRMWRATIRHIFFETWLPKILDIETKTGRMKLERAHGSMAPKPLPAARPRPVLVRFHNFREKQRVMNASREMGKRDLTLRHENNAMMIFYRISLRLFFAGTNDLTM